MSDPADTQPQPAANTAPRGQTQAGDQPQPLPAKADSSCNLPPEHQPAKPARKSWDWPYWLGVLFALLVGAILCYVGGRNDLSKTGNWLLSAIFAAAFFSVNFAFIGYNLSPYSKLWRRLSPLHWTIFGVLLLLPFIPVPFILISPQAMWEMAMLVAPITAFLSFHTYRVTAEMLDPIAVLKTEFCANAIDDYRRRLTATVDEDRRFQKTNPLVPRGDAPMHMLSYHPLVIETETGQLWDRLLALISISVDMHDFSVFSAAFDRAFAIYESLMTQTPGTDPTTSEGLAYIATRRLHTIIALATKSPSDRVFVEAINNVLCKKLLKSGPSAEWRNALPLSIVQMIATICSEALTTGKDYDALKGMNTIHAFTSAALQNIRSDVYKVLDTDVIARCASQIKTLGQHAIRAGDVEFLYRCLDSLVWLGCEMAKKKVEPPLLACISGLVQLGREARAKKLQCFWERCILPPHIHAEEKLGDILTWLVQVPGRKGWYLQDTMTTAYSRLRGYECRLEPNAQLNPKFWIKDTLDTAQQKIPYQESLMGADGYNWTLDYSDENELKESTLHAF